MMNRKLQTVLLLLLFMFCGCAHYRLRIPVALPSDSDWRMYGGGIGRNNVAYDTITPPLDSTWEYNAEAGFSPSTAVAAGNLLYIGNLIGEIHTVTIGTGKKAGVYDFGSAIVGTPIIEGDMMYVALANDNEGLKAYNLNEAQVKWQRAVGDIETSPLIIGNKLLATVLDGKLVCVDKESGDILWTYQIAPGSKTNLIHSSPASNGNTVVFGCDNGAVYGVNVNTGQLQWNAKTRSAVFSSPSIRDGRVYLGSTDSTFYALDVSTGKQLWAKHLPGKIHNSQAVDQNHVYTSVVGGEIYCLNSDDGQIVWKTNINGVINSSPILSGDALYIGTLNKILYAIDAHSGSILWQYKTKGRIKSMPIVFKNHLFLFAEDRSVISFEDNNRK